jgi:hypothetical protein
MDMTLKGIPEGISEEQVKEWVNVLIERKCNQTIQKIPELVVAQENAKKEIDAFRTANSLKAKFTVAEKPLEPEVVQ